MDDMDALAWPHTKGKRKKKTEDIGTVADFIEILNATVGKHLKCCICLSILEDPVMLPCNHPLCRGCATQCLRQNQRCPQCMNSIPNLRMLQGRNKWIAEMVGSLKDCLNEVGVSLTQHGPVPAKYRDKPPPESGAAGAAARQRARARARAAAENARRHPPASCGGAGGGGGSSSSGRGRGAGRRKGRGTGRGAGSRSRERTAPARAAPAPTLSSSWSDGDNDADASPCPPPPSPPPPPPPPQQPFVVGDLVFVESRTWPGMNKHGGVALVTTVLHPPGSAYDVKYSVGQKFDRGVEARYVHAYAFPEETVGSRSRRGGSRTGNARPRRRSGGGVGGGGGGVSPRRASRAAAAAAGVAAHGAVDARSTGIGVAGASSAAVAAAAAGDNPRGLQSSQPLSLVSDNSGLTGTGQKDEDRAREDDLSAAVFPAEPVSTADPPLGASAAAAASYGATPAADASAAPGISLASATASEGNSGAEGLREGGTAALGQHDDGSDTSRCDEAPGLSCHSDVTSNTDHDAEDTYGGGHPSGGGAENHGGSHEERDDGEDNGERGSRTNVLQVITAPTKEGEQNTKGGAAGLKAGGGGVSGGLAAPSAACSASSSTDKLDAVQEKGDENERERTSRDADQEPDIFAQSDSKPPPRSRSAGNIISDPSETGEVALPLSPSGVSNLAWRPLGPQGQDNEDAGAGKRRRRDAPSSLAEGGTRDQTLAGAAAGLLALAAKSVIATHAVGAGKEGGGKGPGIGDGGGDGGAEPPVSAPRASSQKSAAGLDNSDGPDGRLVTPGEARQRSPLAAAAAAALDRVASRPSKSPSMRSSCPEQHGGDDGGADGEHLPVDEPSPPATFVEEFGECGADSAADDNLENDGESPAPSPPPSSPPARPSGLSASGAQRSPLQAILPPSFPSPTSSSTPKYAPSSLPAIPLTEAAQSSPPPPSFKADDLVSVLPRSSPGINQEGGVAKVTRVHADGTYDVKYILRQGRERGLAPAFVSRYTVDADDSDGTGNGGGGGSNGGGGKERGGGRGAVARTAAMTSSPLSTEGGRGDGARPARAVRRTPRANKGWCSPDLAMGQANAACLSYLLGETQNPELDLDPDLGELLDPDEGSNGGGTGGGGGGGEGVVSGKMSAPPAGKARKQRDALSPAAAVAAVAAAESTTTMENVEDNDDEDTAAQESESTEQGGGGRAGELPKSKGNEKRRRGGAAGGGALGGSSQGQGRRQRRRSASDASGGPETFDLSSPSPVRPGSRKNTATLLTTDALDPEVRGIGGGNGSSNGSQDVFDLSALTPGSDSGDVGTNPVRTVGAADRDAQGGGGGGDGGRRGKAGPARSHGRGGGRAPPSDEAGAGAGVAVKKRARPLGKGAAESENVQKRASGVKKSEAVVTKTEGGGGVQESSGNGRRGRAAVSATAVHGEPAVVLTMSGSNAEMSALAGSLAKSLGWRVEPKYTESVTHVVCGTVPKTKKAKVRSAKFLRAVASGKWVLTESWLQECKRRKARAEEEAFEVSGDKKSPVPSAPTRSRLAHAEVGRPGLFRGITFHFRGEFGTTGSPPLAELESMLLANAGRVVNTLEALFADPAGEPATAAAAAAATAGRRRSDSVGGGGGIAVSGGGGSGGWRPKRVVIFHPSSDAPEEEARVLKGELAALAGGGEPSQQQQQQQGSRAEVVKPIWLVDSVGCFRVLRPAVHHRLLSFQEES